MKNINKRITQRKSVADRMHLLTERQLAVLRMTGEGFTEPQMASKLRITDKTIDTHKKNTVKKLGLKDRAEYKRVTFKYAGKDWLGSRAPSQGLTGAITRQSLNIE